MNEQRAEVFGDIYTKIDGKILDEHSQINAKLFHADAYITSVGTRAVHSACGDVGMSSSRVLLETSYSRHLYPRKLFR